MDLVLRAIVVFIFVFVLTRIIGRRELSSMQPFDLILLIVLGDAIQQGLTQDDYSVTGAVIVVHNGEVIERNLKRERLTVDDVAEEARKQQIAQLSEVKFAVLETSGTISFIEKRSS